MGRSLLAICILMYGVLAASCVRDVEIDLGDLPDRIVLNASVSPGKDVRAHVSKTWFIMIMWLISIYRIRKSVSTSMASFKV